jgi:glycosyltransferase involved in cell wall biosynthesis
LGVLSRKESLDYLNKSEFCIYPSKIETIGLGIVEALFLEKKVICSNIDCLREIVSPSLTFDPNSPEEIAKSIITALTNSLPPSKILIENKIDDFVFLLKDISR